MTGLHLSQYRIDAELGRGGMGIVYKATDTKLNRTVALKVLPASALASDEDRARFFREAQSAAQLHHPNIATIFQIDEAIPVNDAGAEVGATDGPRPFIAMEFVEGDTLSDHIRKGPVALREAVSIAGMVAEALKEAHAKNIVHRDIKSANVMLTPGGIAKVLDFGLAKTNQSTMLTRMGSTLGTVAYMSPEQARGQEVDGRTDLYALGTMLYEMVAGRLPFAGDYEQAVLYSILNEPAEPLTALRTGVPMELERITTKLLAKEAEYRYQTAADLIADLKSLSLGGSGVSRRSMAAASVAGLTAAGTEVGPFGMAVLPKWVWGAMVAIGLVALAAGWFAKPAAESQERYPIYLDIDLPDVVSPLTAAWMPDGRSFYYLAKDPESSETYVNKYDLTTGSVERREGSEGARFLNVSPDGRWLVYFDTKEKRFKRALASGGRPSVMAGTGTVVGTGAYSADGYFYYTATSGDVLRASEEGVVDTVAFREGTGHFFVWPLPTPDGNGLFWMAGTQPTRPHEGGYYLNAATGESSITLPQHSVNSLLGNGYALLYPRSGGSLGEPWAVGPVDLETGRLLAPAVPLEPMSSAALAPAGHLLFEPVESAAIQQVGEGVFLLDATGAKMTLDSAPGTSNDFAAAWSRKAIVIESRVEDGDGRDLFLFDIEAGTYTRLTRDGANENPDWSPDDRYVYFNRTVEGAPMFVARRLVDAAASIEPVVVDSFRNGNPTLSPDGRILVYTSERPGTGWDLFGRKLDTGETFSISEADGSQSDADFSPDGRYVVYRSGGERNGAIIVTPLDGSGDVQVADDAGYPVWSPDGRYIYYQHQGNELRRIEVNTDPVFVPGRDESVYSNAGFNHVHFDVLPDGTIILAELSEGAAGAEGGRVRLVLNFDLEMERLAPLSGSNQ